MILVSILCLYTLVFVGVSAVQISFLKKESLKEAAILDEKDYKQAAQIGITNEKFSIFSHIYTLILYSAWLLWGFALLKNALVETNSTLENTAFLLAFFFFC